MEKDKKVKIVLTGGHAATAAIATLEELTRRQDKDWEIYWIGAEKAVEGKKVPTLESQIFPTMGVKTYPIKAGRIQRRFSFWTIPSLIKIPFGFLHALYLLVKIRPKIILSFGAFAAFPVVVGGWLLGIPIIIHEQTNAAGRANRASSFFAKKIAIARAASKKFFPAKKCVVTGNPILSRIGQIPPKPKMGTPATIFMTCGSRGSQTVNGAVAPILEALLSRYLLVHQTGSIDYQKFFGIKKALPAMLAKNYEVYERIDPMQIDNFYRRADIVVARAGANTTSEIIATKRPSILIPIPWSYLDEQTKNAKFAEQFGIARVIRQEVLSPAGLLRAIRQTALNWEKIIASVRNKKSPDVGASKRLLDVVEGVLG